MVVGAPDRVGDGVDIGSCVLALVLVPEAGVKADPDAAEAEPTIEELPAVLPEVAVPLPVEPKLTLNVGEKE